MKILADLFPAHLAVLPEGAIDDIYDLHCDPATESAYYLATTRVVITEELVVVAQDSPEGARIVFQEAYETYLPAKSGEEGHIITVSGKMLAFKKDSNCGCGSRLRSWNPYKTLSSSKDPV